MRLPHAISLLGLCSLMTWCASAGSGGSVNGSGADSVTVGGQIAVQPEEVRHNVVVVGGQAHVDGHVTDSVVVILGRAELGSQAQVAGDVVAFLGQIDRQPGARIQGQYVVIGDGPAGMLGTEWFRYPQQWFNQGLLWARVFPHQYAWPWALGLFCLLVYGFIYLLFPGPVERSVTALEKAPGTALLVGVLAVVLTGPLLFLCVVTVVGIVVIPFLLGGMVAAFLVGKLAVYRYTGGQLHRGLDWGWLARPIPALAVGLIVFFVLYMVPVLGLAAWGTAALLGIGGAILALFQSLGAEGRGTASGVVAAPDAIPPTLGAWPAAAWPRAGFWWRLFALLLDLLLVSVVVRILVPRDLDMGPPFFLVWLLYHLVLWAWKGATVGGLILRLRVVRRDGGPVDFATALVRTLAAFVSALPLFLGFIWVAWDREKQAWHDKIAGTLVVRMPPEAPQPARVPAPPPAAPPPPPSQPSHSS